MGREIFYTPPFVTVRSDSDSSVFRPSATGLDIDETAVRAEMEQLEMNEISNNQAGYVVASAAHSNADQSVKNAYFESAEKINLAVWWAYRNDVLSRVDSRLTGIPNNNLFETITALIPVHTKIGYCAITLLRNNEYPYYVLGSGFSNSEQDATSKSYLESINSWVGTKWTEQNGGRISWDIGELSKRWDQLNKIEPSKRPLAEAPLDSTVSELREWLKDLKLNVISHRIGRVALLCHSRSLLSYELARMFEQNDNIEVYTNPNN